MDKPMTTKELFEKIQDILKEKGKLPDILDYGIATNRPVPIRIYEFELKNNLDYGGSEGIYLDLWIEYFEDDEWIRNEIGTFKTLENSKEAMHVMAGLLADFIIEGSAYINANLDYFTWTGVDVRAFDENGKSLDWCYSCSDMESALARKDELLEKYPQVAVRDNDARLRTMVAMAMELRGVGIHKAEVVLAVGLPFSNYGRDKPKLIDYYSRQNRLEFTYEGEEYSVAIDKVIVCPQCYSAIASRLGNMRGDYLVVDIGSKTTDVVYTGRRFWLLSGLLPVCALVVHNGAWRG